MKMREVHVHQRQAGDSHLPAHWITLFKMTPTFARAKLYKMLPRSNKMCGTVNSGALESKQVMVVVLCELSRVFDCTFHGSLAQKLVSFELTICALRMDESYLCDRQQIVSFRGVNSAHLMARRMVRARCLNLFRLSFLTIISISSSRFRYNFLLIKPHCLPTANIFSSLLINWLFHHLKLPPTGCVVIS